MAKTAHADVVKNQVIAIDKLDPHPQNYRKHPERQLEKLAAALSRFGQVRSIVVQPQMDSDRFTIVAGHGTTQAAKRLGLTELRCDVVPVTWDELKIKGYMLADNMGGAQDDPEMLAELLQEQATVDLDSTGSDMDALGELLLGLAESEAKPVNGEAVKKDGPQNHLGDARKQIKAVLYVNELDVFEAAILATGNENRGQALLEICQHYIDTRPEKKKLEPPIVERLQLKS